MPKRGQINLDNIHTDFFMDETFKSARTIWTIKSSKEETFIQFCTHSYPSRIRIRIYVFLRVFRLDIVIFQLRECRRVFRNTH